MDGLLVIDKPEGITSADVVRVVKRKLRCKTGHLGTLDPFASGVLPLCLGEGTKVAQFLNAADKEYAGIIRLGAATDTGDPTGRVTRTTVTPAITAARLQEVAASFVGERSQTPPMYSAVKRGGTALYKLARQGIEVERAPRRVRIDSLVLASAGLDAIGFTVACSKGTYIRVLAEEIAVALGTVGHLGALRRTRFGPFRIAEAVELDRFVREGGTVLGVREALRGVREIPLDAVTAARARSGAEVVLRGLPAGPPDQLAKLIGPAGDVIGVVVMTPAGWRFARVLSPADAPSGVP